MNWRELTETDLLGCLNAMEREGYTQVISRGDDPVSSLLTNAVHECRGRIAAQAAKANQDMPEGAVLPPEVIPHVLAIVRHRLLAWADITVSDARKTEFESAEKFMTALGKGEVRVTLQAKTSPVDGQKVSVRPGINTAPARELQGS